MTEKEIIKTIISHWRLEHSPFEISRALTLAGLPTSQASVLQVILRYCEGCTENRQPEAGVIPGS